MALISAADAYRLTYKNSIDNVMSLINEEIIAKTKHSTVDMSITANVLKSLADFVREELRESGYTVKTEYVNLDYVQLTISWRHVGSDRR